MEQSKLAILLYWGGEYSEASETEYSGGTKKLICIDSSMKFMDLTNRVYEIVRCDRMFVNVRLFLRIPLHGRYIVVPLDDDDALLAMWHMVSKISAPLMEMYVKEVENTNNVEGNLGTIPVSDAGRSVPFGSFSGILSDSSDANMAEVASPAPSPQIENLVHRPFTNEMFIAHRHEVDSFDNLEGHVDSDPEEDEGAREAVDKAIRDGAPSQDLLRIDEIDQRLIDSWMTWQNNKFIPCNSEFEVGQEFDSLAHVKFVVKTWSILNHYNFRVLESEPTKYVVRCVHDCPWRLRAIMTPTLTFKIVKYSGPHASTCAGEISSGADNPLLSSEFVADLIHEFVRANPGFKVSSIVRFIKDKYQSLITYKRAWLAKEKALSKIFGEWERSFEELSRYLQALQDSNEGTIVYKCTIPTEDPSVEIFQRVFWAFRPSIEGFHHCRPLISIGATHLYGKYKGTFLIAMGTDADFELFPLAFAVVEGENNDSWSWFMTCIRQSVTNREGLCVISNFHEGILALMNKPNSRWEEPYALHRLCIRHLAANVETKFKNTVKNGVIKNLVYRAASSSQLRKFERYMGAIRSLNVEAATYLSQIPPHQWSLHHDGGFRYGVKTTNMSEMFNGMMKGIRCLPITALVQMTFYRVNLYFVDRREMTRKRLEEGHQYSPKATTIIGKNMEKASAHKVIVCETEQGAYKVITGCGNRPPGKGGNTHSVNLLARSCTCGKLGIFKLPCSHVLAVCRFSNLSHDDFVDSFFTTREYRSTYLPSFTPGIGRLDWVQYTGPRIIPNDSSKRPKGRPKSTLTTNAMDQPVCRKRNRCSICYEEGHNKKLCPKKDCGGS